MCVSRWTGLVPHHLVDLVCLRINEQVTCIICLACGAALFAVQSILVPNQSLLISTQAPPQPPQGMFRLTLDIHGGTVSQCADPRATLQDTLFAQNWVTPTGSVVVASSQAVYVPTDGVCRVSWTCEACTLLSATATFQYQSTSPAWASFVRFTLETPALVSTVTGLSPIPQTYTTTGYIFPARSVQTSTSFVLQGARESVVNLLLTEYVHKMSVLVLTTHTSTSGC